jgi:hypothetical protein
MTFSLRHFESPPAARRRLSGVVFRRKIQTRPVVLPPAPCPLCGLALLLQQLLRAIALVGAPARDELVGKLAMAPESLRLEVGCVRAADAGPFVPRQPQPAHGLENAGDHFVGRPFGLSSMRRTNAPPCRRANSQLNSAVRAPPICR